MVHRKNFLNIYFLFLVFLYYFGDCPGTHSVHQDGLELTEICLHLSLPPSAGIVSHQHPAILLPILAAEIEASN